MARAARLGHRVPAVPPPGAVQRAITVQNVDFNPKPGGGFRHGFIDQGRFYAALRAAITQGPRFGVPHRNQLANVVNTVSQQSFVAAEIPALVTAIALAVRTEFGNRGVPVRGGAIVADLDDYVRDALVANIQPDLLHPQTPGEAAAFDLLLQAPHVVASRAKGTPSTIPYASLPNPVQTEVAARLTQIRNERAQWTAAGIGPEYTLPDDAFKLEVLNRQRGFNYQGNHTNNAGWLPAVAPPADLVTPIGHAIYAAATRALQGRMTRRNPLRGMDYLSAGGQGRQNRYRTEYENLRAPHLPSLNNANVKLSAMAALCQGVSAYIEFSMSHDVSRLVYEPVNSRVYIATHYKWHLGYNPFFEVTGFPAL
jgi:hypothetical protein